MNHSSSTSSRGVGRAATIRPPNRFESTRREDDCEQLNSDTDPLDEAHRIRTEFLPDQSRTVIVENDSPDIPFRYGINPYRGCEHGCAYCYARPGRMRGMENDRQHTHVGNKRQDRHAGDHEPVGQGISRKNSHGTMSWLVSMGKTRAVIQTVEKRSSDQRLRDMIGPAAIRRAVGTDQDVAF